MFHAALVLFNYLLAFENESKKWAQSLLELAIRGINNNLSKGDLTDKDTLVALLLCECRILFKNHDLTVWLEEQFGEFYQVMAALKAREADLAPEVA